MSNTPNPTAVPVVHLDTLDFEPEHRFEIWQQNVGVLFDMSSPDGGKLDNDINAQFGACNLGEAVFALTRSEAQLFERKARRVAHDDMDHILVQVFLSGGGLANGDEQIVAGDMLIIDMDQPHAMVNTEFENLSLLLPRELHTGLSELLAPLHGTQLSSTNPMVRFLGEHIRALWKTVPDMNMIQAGSALQGTLGLLEGWLSREGRLSEEITPDVSKALGKLIRRYIERNLSEPLAPQELVQIFGVSRSHLYQIFAPYDGVARYVLKRRMLRSFRMLSQPVYNHLSVGAVAFQCGFSSESHFSRSFKSRFGVTPGQVRADALEILYHPQQQSDTSLDKALVFQSWVRDLPRICDNEL